MNGSGHLCNTETANFLASNYKPHLRNIWLCHLSHNNNRPELARRTVEEAFEKEGITVDKQLTITALQRMVPSELYVLD
jgi:phosphoribosyl 1,2-cyclic phosphodiesterase